MSAALLVGLGAVGSRAARQLVDGDHVDRVFIACRHHERAERAAKTLGDGAVALRWEPGDPFPSELSVVVSAAPDPIDAALAAAALGAGRAFASSNDSHVAIERRMEGSAVAASTGVAMAIGAGLVPGLADLLVAHAAASFDEIEEIRVARSGWAGPASVATLRHEMRGPVSDWHDGQWRALPRTTEEIVYFPDPIGARTCMPARLGAQLLVQTFPTVGRISVTASEPVGRVKFHRHRRRGDEAEWGATRIEVWGRRAGESDVVVYGAIDRTAIAAGTVLAVTALALAGAVDVGFPARGVFGLGACARPVDFFDELRGRGVRAAVFEGAPVSD